jgi:hypothetical protein
MKPTTPDDLIAQIARQNCVVFVGAGLSEGAGLPGWSKLLHQMISWCESHNIDLSNKADIENLLDEKKDMLAAADVLRAKMGDDNYRQFMEEVFLRPDLKPAEVHRILSRIPFVCAGTTNYDQLVEEGYRETHPGESFNVFTQVDHEHLGTSLHAKRFFVLKAHGTIERFDTIVLGWKEYNRLIHASEGYRTFLRALFINRTVLFIGFSMTDPELLLLLGGLKEVFKGHTPTHYALMNVSSTTQTEQELFEENYGVKIISYTPSAIDHPEVKAFLLELSEKVTQNAAWHQVEELRKAAETDDPHYRVVFTSDNEFIIKERYPNASEERPLKFSITVNRNAHEAIKRTLATGEPLDIKGEDIIDVKFPDIINRFINITEHIRITSGVGRGDKKLTVKAVIESPDGENASLDNIVLENIQGGDEQAIMSNESQDVPWKFRQIIKSNERESPLTFTLDNAGASIKRSLEGLRFGQVLSKGGHFHFENVETGEEYSPAEVPPGAVPSPDPLFIRVLESLEFIQKETGILFTSPQNISPAEIEYIFAVERILRTGRIEVNPPSIIFTNSEGARNDIERFSQGETVPFMQYSDDWVFIILGKQVFLGPVLIACEMFISPEDLEALRKAVEDGISKDNPMEVRLTPVPGLMLEAKVLYWLPAEEAEEIRKMPFVRMTSLKNLIRLLFDTAKQGTDTFNVQEFMTLLDEARRQTSEQGVPLSSLISATPAELITAFEPGVAELRPDEKLNLALSLCKGGWLPEDEAACLAGLDIATFKKEQVKADNKASIVGSDK